jgi:hypothetical protein
VAGVFARSSLVFVSVGDSSIWRFRENEVHRVNITHERAAEMDVRAAEIGTDEAWSLALGDEQRSSITSAVMGSSIQKKQIAHRPVADGDILIFAGDGIETLSLEHLRSAVPALGAQGGAAAIANGLAAMIDRTGGKSQDNATLVVVRATADPARPDIETRATMILPGGAGGPRADQVDRSRGVSARLSQVLSGMAGRQVSFRHKRALLAAAMVVFALASVFVLLVLAVPGGAPTQAPAASQQSAGHKPVQLTPDAPKPHPSPSHMDANGPPPPPNSESGPRGKASQGRGLDGAR